MKINITKKISRSSRKDIEMSMGYDNAKNSKIDNNNTL